MSRESARILCSVVGSSTGSGLLLFLLASDNKDQPQSHVQTTTRQLILGGVSPLSVRTLCEAAATASTTTTIPDPHWIRRALVGLLGPLPLPRRLGPQDLVVSRGLLRQRAADAARVATLQQALAAAVAARDTQGAQALVAAVYATLYGDGVTPQGRTDFLTRYGCTGWNDDILAALCRVADGRGLVEIGAGHGQWARALQDYRQGQWQAQAQAQQTKLALPHPRTLVRAYDNASKLPLNPRVYHNGTAVHAKHFGHVLPCPDVASVLAQFENRGRILMLVYPPADDTLAADALRAYTALTAAHDTLVYVGEGRRGANASDDFFDLLETVDDDGMAWCLLHILPGVPCGTKGEECVYILQRRRVTP